jgi:hypothetical protein
VGVWERVRAALRREKRDLDQAIGEATDRANRALDERERELTATPEEKLRIEQARAEETDAEFEALRKRIEDGV